MELSILIASNGGAERTMRCLQSLAETVPESLAFEVVFVDDGSSDGTSEALSSVDGDFVLLRNENEIGYTAACGQAARAAHGEILTVVPNHAIAQPGWIEPLIAALNDDPKLDAVRPALTRPCAAPAATCVALRRASIAEALAGDRSELSDERIGAAILAAATRARIEVRSTVMVEALVTDLPAPVPAFPPLDDPAAFSAFLAALADTDAARGSEPVTSSPLTAVLLDGSRPPAERAIAGVILSASTPSEAITAAVRTLLGKLDPSERTLIASRLEPHGWEQAWNRIAAGDSRPTAEYFRWDGRPCCWGVPGCDPEYEQVVSDLQLLNDVLADSPLAGRYWIFGGMLIGWARDGDLIRGDLDDFDFAFRGSDLEDFRVAMVDLIKAGFLPRYRYPSVLEPCAAFVLVRHATKFEFYRMEPDDPGWYRYHSFGHRHVPIRNTHRYPRQSLVPIEFLDRYWLKSQDHEVELTLEYGDWRTPDPGWDYMSGYNIVARDPYDMAGFELLNMGLS